MRLLEPSQRTWRVRRAPVITLVTCREERTKQPVSGHKLQRSDTLLTSRVAREGNVVDLTAPAVGEAGELCAGVSSGAVLHLLVLPSTSQLLHVPNRKKLREKATVRADMRQERAFEPQAELGKKETAHNGSDNFVPLNASA